MVEVGVSVIIPIYNMESYLKRCLNSVFDQTFQDFEVIAVNDGSTDNSGDIIKEFSSKHENKIRYFVKENGGLASALNRGLSEAKGKYVVFLDADDYISVDFLENLFTEAEKDQCEMVVSGQYKVRPDGTIADSILYKPDENGNSVLRRLNLHGKFYLRKYIEEQNLSFPEGKTYEDNSFNIVAYFLAKDLHFLEYAGYFQLVHDGSITSQKIQYGRLPIQALDQAVDHVEQNKELVQDEKLFEFTVMTFFTYFIFVRNKKKEYLDKKDAASDIQEVMKICEDFQNITKKYFPHYVKNKYFNLFKYKQLDLTQKLGTAAFAIMVKTNMLKPFVKLYYRF